MGAACSDEDADARLFGGRDATAWNTHITNPRVRGLSGNPGYQAIECQTAPKQGRTGGGLFTNDGYLAGVCNFAEPKGDHGLYAGPDSIYRLLDRNHLTFLYDASVVTEKEIDDLLRAAEEQLEKDDREGAGRTIHQVDALIEARRKGLQDALRSLDANDSRRRDELFRRASESAVRHSRECDSQGRHPRAWDSNSRRTLHFNPEPTPGSAASSTSGGADRPRARAWTSGSPARDRNPEMERGRASGRSDRPDVGRTSVRRGRHGEPGKASHTGAHHLDG